MIQNEFMI